MRWRTHATANEWIRRRNANGFTDSSCACAHADACYVVFSYLGRMLLDVWALCMYVRVTGSTPRARFSARVVPAGDNLCPCPCPRVRIMPRTLTRRVGYPRISAPASRITIPNWVSGRSARRRVGRSPTTQSKANGHGVSPALGGYAVTGEEREVCD
jgi:hypothetical protein